MVNLLVGQRLGGVLFDVQRLRESQNDDSYAVYAFQNEPTDALLVAREARLKDAATAVRLCELYDRELARRAADVEDR